MHLCLDLTCYAVSRHSLLSEQAHVSLFLGTGPIPGQDLSLIFFPLIETLKRFLNH